MTTREAFEKWYDNEYMDTVEARDKYRITEVNTIAKSAWQAAKAECEKKIDYWKAIANRPVTDNTQLIANMEREIAELQAHINVLRDTLEEIAGGMNTKAINNEVIKSSTLEMFAEEIKQAIATQPTEYNQLNEGK